MQSWWSIAKRLITLNEYDWLVQIGKAELMNTIQSEQAD